MGGLRLPSLSPSPNTCPQGRPCLDCPLWSAAGLKALVKSPSPGSWSVAPWELLRLKSPQSEPCPTLSPTASSPPAPAPGLWDCETAEGLALHTNVLSIVKAPLCQRAPLRRLGRAQWGSVPKFPQTVTCFQSLPTTTPHPPQCPESLGEWTLVGGGRACRQYDTFPLDRLVRWAFDRADCGRQSLDHRGGGGLWRELECRSVRPMTEKGTHSLPMLPSICPA